MSLLEPTALAWLGILPVLVLLWRTRLRRTPARVSAGFLWERACREARVDSFSKRLQANLLLFLQLLAALALGLALARPSLPVVSGSAAEMALLIDTSASMGARQDGSTRLEVARGQARRLIREAPSGAQILVASCDRSARVLLPFTRDRSAALRALEDLEVREVAADGQAGWALAASLLASRPEVEVFLMGDQPPQTPPPSRLTWIECGGTAANVGLVALRAARDHDGTFPLVVGVRNYGPRPEQRELELRRGGVLLAARRVGLPAGGRQTLRFRLPASGSDLVEARLLGSDALAVDDRAWTVLPRRATLRARVVGPGNLFAERALAAIPGLVLTRSEHPAGEGLAMWQGEVPWPLPPGVHILLHPPAAWRRGERLDQAFTLQPERAPLLNEVPLADLGVAGVTPLNLPPGSEILARAGPHPALALVRQGPATALVLAFDLCRSDLPLSPALPLLFANLVESELGGGRGPVDPESVPGQPLEIRTMEPVWVQGPDTSVRLASEAGRAILPDPDRTGVYQVRVGEKAWPVAMNMLDPRESDLATRRPAPRRARPGPAPTSSSQRSGVAEFWPWLAGAGLLALLAEWLVDQRRRRPERPQDRTP